MTAVNETKSHSSKSHITIWLGYLGLIPFLIPLWQMIEAVNIGVGVHSASVFGLYAPYIFISYSAIILSFLAGILWSKGKIDSQHRVSKAAIFLAI